MTAWLAELLHTDIVASLAVGGVKKSKLPDPLRVPRPGDAVAESSRKTYQDIRRGLLGGA